LVLLLMLAGCAPAAVAVQQPQAQIALPPTPVQVQPVPTAEPLALPTEQPVPTAVPEPAQPVAVPTAVPTAMPQVAAPVQADACDSDTPRSPLPAPGSSGAPDFFRSFREPLAPTALYNPPGPKHVGLQAGHWLTDQVPPELGRLQQGATGGGKQEWQVNLDVAQRTAGLLQDDGIQVDVLPATVPPHYQANVFIALHADGDPAGQARGFKIARPGFSSIPSVDDQLVETLNTAYAAATGLPRDDEHISLRMRYYYAFNSRRYCHAVAPGVPQAIVEMAYLTNATDRQYLIGDPQRLAQALADGIQAFLATTP